MAAENGNPPKAEDPAKANGRRTRSGMTIDLEANAVPEDTRPVDNPTVPEPSATDKPVPDMPGGSGPPETVTPRPAFVSLVFAGVVGAIAALGVGYGLQAAGIIPAPGQTVARQALAETVRIKDATSALDQRLTVIESASAQSDADHARVDELSRKVSDIDSLVKPLSDRLLSVEASIAALKDAAAGGGKEETQQALDALSSRVTRLETATPPASDGRSQQMVDALSKRVARLESKIATAAEGSGAVASSTAPVPAPAESSEATTNKTSAPVVAAPTMTDEKVAARTAALAAFQNAAAQGGPFSAELDAVGQLGIAPTAVAQLKPLAEKGAPTTADLVARFAEVADAMLLAAKPAAGAGAGFFGRLAAYGRSLVKVRPSGSQPAGEDTGAIVERMRAAVDDGDLAKALTERKALSVDGQAASQAWADAVGDRLEIERLAAVISASAETGNSSG